MKVTLFLAALALASLPAVAQARPTGVSGAPTIDVPYGDLNLSRRAGAEVALSRIRAAATQVCGGQPENLDLTAFARYRSCVSAAVRNAVADLNAEMVTQLYAGNSRARRGTYVSQR